MFFRKKFSTVTVKKSKVRLDLAPSMTNGDFSRCNNVRRAGNGLRSIGDFVPMGILNMNKVIASKDGFLYTLGKDGVYCNSKYSSYKLISKAVDSACCVLYNRRLIFSSQNIGTYLFGTNSADMLSAKGYDSLTICGDRLIGVDSIGVAVASAGDYRDFDDAQVIYTHVPCTSVVALGNELYILGDTCYTLVPNADEIDLKFRPFVYEVGMVEKESVVQMGKRAIFATDCGLRMLTSNKVTPIFQQLNDYINFVGCNACEHQGKYYISCKRKEGNSAQNDLILVLDIDNQVIDGVLSTKYTNLFSDGDKLYATGTLGVYYLQQMDCAGVVHVSNIDFDNSNVKYLHRLTISTSKDVFVWINTDNEKRRYAVKGKSGVQSLPIAGVGRQFTVQIDAPSGARIDSVELCARSYEV